MEANERLGFEADLRHQMPAEILRYFGVRSVRLLSNNPDKIAALERWQVRVAERIPCIVAPHESTRELPADQETEDGPFVGLSLRPANFYFLGRDCGGTIPFAR